MISVNAQPPVMRRRIASGMRENDMSVFPERSMVDAARDRQSVRLFVLSKTHASELQDYVTRSQQTLTVRSKPYAA